MECAVICGKDSGLSFSTMVSSAIDGNKRLGRGEIIPVFHEKKAVGTVTRYAVDSKREVLLVVWRRF